MLESFSAGIAMVEVQGGAIVVYPVVPQRLLRGMEAKSVSHEGCADDVQSRRRDARVKSVGLINRFLD